MKRALARLLPEVLRLSLAAVVLLAGLSSARMQGQMSAVAFGDMRGSVLCSGTVLPGDPLNQTSDHDHSFCLLCHGATGNLPGPGVSLSRRIAVLAMLAVPTDLTGSVANLPSAYFARGPPQAT